MNSVTQFKVLEDIETSRLQARKLTAQDFGLVLPLYQNHYVMHTLREVLSEQEAHAKFAWNVKQWIEKGIGQWLWFEKTSACLIGRGGLRRIEIEGKEEWELGYALLPEFWNKGFATELAKASVEIAFNWLNIKEIIGFTLTTNLKSQHVLEKLGFQFEGNFTYQKEPHVFYRLLRSATY